MQMTTRATLDGRVVVLRLHFTTPTEKGASPSLVVDQVQRLSLSSSGHLVVDTDNTTTGPSVKVPQSTSRQVYTKAK
jgi:hypothetical protein